MWFRRRRATQHEDQTKTTLSPFGKKGGASGGRGIVQSPLDASPRPLGPDWIDELVRDAEARGDFGDLPGKGQPLHLDDSIDMVTRVMKAANILPPWIDLQREIARDLARILTQMQSGQNVDDEIQKVNGKIARYNQICPASFLQRSWVTPDNIARQYRERWE